MYHPSSAGAQADTSYIWPDCLKIARHLAEDSQIPAAVRERAEQTLHSFFRDKMFILGLRSALRGNFTDAHKSAYILRSHYRASLKFLTLEYAARILERSRSINKLAVISFKAARFLSQRKHRNLQRQFGHLSRFLEIQVVANTM